MEVNEEEEVLPWSLGHRVSRCWVLGSPNPERMEEFVTPVIHKLGRELLLCPSWEYNEA